MIATGSSSKLAGKAASGRKLIAVVYADMAGYSRRPCMMPARCTASALCGEC